MIKRIIPLLAVVFFSVATPVLAADNGTIDGQIVNGTVGGSSVGDLTITLTTFIDNIETSNATARTDAGGRFSFAGIATGQEYAYEASVTFQDALYTDERIAFGAGEISKSVSIQVYDSTNTDSVVRISVAHTVMTPVDGGLQVMEFMVFSNNSDRNYTGFGDVTVTGTRRTLRLPLPDSATDLQIGGELMSCCILQDPAGFFDTMSVKPGDKTIIYSYRLPNSAASYAFIRKVDYPTDSYNLLVQGPNIGLSAPGLVPSSEPVDLNGTLYSSISGGNLARGETLNIMLKGLTRSGSQHIVIWVLLVVFLLAVGGGFAYLMMRKRNLLTVGASSSPDEQRQQLLLEIAELDDDFEAGNIEKESYSRLRAEKKSQLVELMQSTDPENRRE